MICILAYDELRLDEELQTYIRLADESLAVMGYTEHSFPHVLRAAELTGRWLRELGYTARDAELGSIAAYLHDIGNVVNRVAHAQSGALMVFHLLEKRGMAAAELARIVSAVGNHDEAAAYPADPIAAALILADKTDVRRSRVRNRDRESFDIHDRVNYAVTQATAEPRGESKSFLLCLEIDTDICPVTDYFEIFLNRMLLCRRAAEFFGLRFRLEINGNALM